MKPIKLSRWPSVLAVLIVSLFFLGAGAAPAMAQDKITVFIITDSFMGKRPGVRVEIGPYSTTTDNAGRGELTVPPGDYTARATTSCAVVRVHWSQSAAMVGGTVQEPVLSFKGGPSGTATVTFLCGAPTQNTVRVKIATRQSCADTPNEANLAADGVSVSIGNKMYTSNTNGVIEIDLPQGTYPISASWKDYAFGFVSQNGLKAKSNEDGLPTVTLRDKVETLEVRMFTCDATGREKARAVITEIGSDIKVIRSRVTGLAFVGMQLRDGDEVVIHGRAKLKWLDGNGIISFDSPTTIIRIGPGGAPAGSSAPAPKRSTVEILKGWGSFLIPKDDSGYDPADFDENGNRVIFRGSTHGVNVGVKGTVFTLGYDDQTQVSTVAVQEGVIVVTPKYPGQKPFELRAGQRAEVSPDGVNGPNPPAGQSGPTVKTTKPVYAPNERIEVEYANPAGHDWDFITIARASDGDQSDVGSSSGNTKWRSYVDKERRGTKTFDGLAEGQYEARYIRWDGGNNRATARSPFTVGNAPPPPTTGGPPTTGEQPPTTGNPPATGNSSDLSGFWVDDTGGGAVYRIRQVGNRIYWSMDATAFGEYVNVFHGVISGNTIDGEWLDMPGSPLRPALVAATLTLRIESNDRLVKVRSGNFYPAQVWTRKASSSTGGPPSSGTTSATNNREKTVTIEVPANRAWTRTGVILRPDELVMVQASGTIQAAGPGASAFYHSVTPGGRPQFHPDKPQQLMSALSMLGRIGDGPVVSIGPFARWYAGGPYSSGELFLGINDDGLDDNSGAWQVRITTFGAPSQPTGGGGGTGTGGESIDWSTNAEAKGCQRGKTFTYSCPAGGRAGSGIYGLDIYSTDSPICPAAVQAGLITFERGGTVTIELVESPPSLSGGNRNGVGSSSGAKRGPCAFKFAGAQTSGAGGPCQPADDYSVSVSPNTLLLGEFPGEYVNVSFTWPRDFGADPGQGHIALYDAAAPPDARPVDLPEIYVLFLPRQAVEHKECPRRLQIFHKLPPGAYEFRYVVANYRIAARAKLTVLAKSNAVVGLVQKIIPGGVEKPKVEEIPARAIGPTKTTGNVNKPGNRRTDQPKVKEIPDEAVVTSKPPTDEVPRALGSDKGNKQTPTDDVPTALGGPTRPLGAALPPGKAKPGSKGSQTPTDEVPRALGSNTGRPPVRDNTGKPPSGNQEERPKDPNKPGKAATIGKVIGAILSGIQQPSTQRQPPTQRQPAGGRWTLVSVTVSPETPPRGGGVTWDYNAQGSSARYALYNGDKADFQWTPPPQEIDRNGFTISVSGQGNPVPNSRIAVTIGVSGSGLTTDTPSDQQSAYAKAENGASASDQKSVTFKPTPGASEIEVRIGMQWAITFTYKYRRAQ